MYFFSKQGHFGGCIPSLEMSGPSNDSCQVKKKVEACGGVLNAMWAGGFEGVFFVWFPLRFVFCGSCNHQLTTSQPANQFFNIHTNVAHSNILTGSSFYKQNLMELVLARPLLHTGHQGEAREGLQIEPPRVYREAERTWNRSSEDTVTVLQALLKLFATVPRIVVAGWCCPREIASSGGLCEVRCWCFVQSWSFFT